MNTGHSSSYFRIVNPPLKVLVKDDMTDVVPEFPNVITPNSDGKNDCFVLENLPDDNCANQFKDVTIFNRWGKQVYYSKIRKNWCPTSVSQGYYYYVVAFTNRTFKGGLTILK